MCHASIAGWLLLPNVSLFFGTSKSVAKPSLGAQHEGKSAHILRSSRADTFSITSGVRRMLPKLLIPTFCSDS